VDTQPTIRQLVEQALYYRQITPEIENGINELLATKAGLISFRVGKFSYQLSVISYQ